MDRFILPGTGGASVYDIGGAFLKSIKDIRLAERAAAISFNFLMAIPPTLIFLFSLVPFLPLDSVQDTILHNLKLLAPNEKLFASAESVVLDFMQTKRRELLSFGFLITIFVSSNGMMGLLRSFDRDSPLLVKRSGMKRRGKAIKLTLIIMFVLLLSISLLILQSNILDKYFIPHIGHSPVIKIISWISLVFIVYITICIIYKYGPSFKDRFRFFSTGALLTTLSFFAVSYGFFYVANHFLHYNKVYGSIGSLLMFMAWMFIISIIMLVGFEINLSILMYRKHKKGQEQI